MARVVAFVIGCAVLYGSYRLYNGGDPAAAAFVGFFALIPLATAFWPGGEQPGAGFDWDVGPYSTAVKLVLLLAFCAFCIGFGIHLGGVGVLLAGFGVLMLWDVPKLAGRLRSFSRSARASLRLDVLPTPQEGRLEGSIEFPARPGTRDARLTLVCNDLMRTSRKLAPEATARWKEGGRVAVERYDTDTQRVRFAFDIPAGMPLPAAPGSADLPYIVPGRTYNEWHLRIEGPVERVFVLPVAGQA